MSTRTTTPDTTTPRATGPHGTSGLLGGLLGIVRMELIRLRRRTVVLGWLGLTALFAVLINLVMFQVVDPAGGSAPPAGPGATFPDAARLLSEHGIVAGLASAAAFFGVVTLSFWAIATASDHSTGLVRLTVAAEPRRGRLFVGKWIALALATAVSTLVAVVVNVMIAPIAAHAGGWEPTAWGTDAGAVVASAALNLFLSLLVWGTLGLLLGGVTRSAGVAIGLGVGYVLLLEGVVKAAAPDAGTWLPGTTITALAEGGTADLGYGGALALGAAYVAIAGLIAVQVFRRRDVTD